MKTTLLLFLILFGLTTQAQHTIHVKKGKETCSCLDYPELRNIEPGYAVLKGKLIITEQDKVDQAKLILTSNKYCYSFSTNSKGEFDESYLPQGLYKLQIYLDNYPIKTIGEVELKNNKLTSVGDILMMKKLESSSKKKK